MKDSTIEGHCLICGGRVTVRLYKHNRPYAAYYCQVCGIGVQLRTEDMLTSVREGMKPKADLATATAPGPQAEASARPSIPFWRR